MAGQPRTIVAEIPGPQQGQQFAFDQTVTFDLESVYIECDTSGAAGPVGARLTILEQSGVVIAKKLQAEQMDVSAPPCSATWALRLADDGAGATPPPSGATLPWGMYTGAISLPDNSAGQPYPDGFPRIAPFSSLHTGAVSPFVLGAGADLDQVCVTEDGIYEFTLAMAWPWTQITGLGIPSPFFAVSLRAGFGNDPEPPFGEDAVYDCSLIGALNVTTIGAVTGASVGAPKKALEIGVVNVGGMDLNMFVGCIAKKLDPRYTPLFP